MLDLSLNSKKFTAADFVVL